MKYILFILCCLGCTLTYSQNYFDILSLQYSRTPQNDFEVSNTQTAIEEIALEFNFPVVLNEKTILLTGVFANKTTLNLDAFAQNTNLNVIGLSVGINKAFNNSWSATFMVYSKIASDKIKLSNDNLQIALLSLFTKKKREDLKFRYGIYGNTENYGLIIVPIFGMYYMSPNKKFVADLNLPIVGDINYNLKNNIWLGIKFDGLGTTYNLNEQNFATDGAYVSKTSNELVTYLRFKLSKSVFLNTKVGYAAIRNYKVYDSEDKISLAFGPFYFGDNRTQLNERFKDGTIFKLELLYRLHFD